MFPVEDLGVFSVESMGGCLEGAGVKSKVVEAVGYERVSGGRPQ